jgi:hypothetical protein
MKCLDSEDYVLSNWVLLNCTLSLTEMLQLKCIFVIILRNM